MIKKLLKYGKILMALTLISALALPSYATIGAADGSAFVTKAEFDAALSDFNARLTTFEAGINSKIDSQVSSYLDRNGIWNGKDQTILNSSTTWGYKFFTDSTKCGSGTYHGWGASNTENATHWTVSASSLYKLQLSTPGDNSKLTEITKSGMAFIDMKLSYSSSSGANGWSFGYTLGEWDQFASTTNVYINTIKVGTSTQVLWNTVNCTDWLVSPWSNPFNGVSSGSWSTNQTVTGFVSKGDTLYRRANSPRNMKSSFGGAAGTMDGNRTYYSCYYTVTKFVVY